MTMRIVTFFELSSWIPNILIRNPRRTLLTDNKGWLRPWYCSLPLGINFTYWAIRAVLNISRRNILPSRVGMEKMRDIDWRLESLLGVILRKLSKWARGLARKIKSWGRLPKKSSFSLTTAFFWESISAVLEGKKSDDEKISFLEKLRDSLLGLQVVRIEVKSEDDAYIFFESINATWMKLSSADILKNLLFKKTSLDAEKLADRWNELLEILWWAKGDPDITRYLRNYWLSRHEKVSKWKIYLSVKNSIDRKEEPLYGWSYDNFLSELIDKAKLYKQILRPNEDELADLLQDMKIAKRITRWLKGIRVLWVVQPYPLLLSLLDKLRNPSMHVQSAISLFSAIEHFTFVYSTVAGKIPSKLEKIYSNFAIRIANSENESDLSRIAEDCRKKLSVEFPKREEFDANIEDFRYWVEKKWTLYYLLWKLAHWGSSEFVIDNVDIEHIFPQNPQNLPLDEDGKKSISVVNDLGNLILVNPHVNKKAWNKWIKEKIEVYSASAIWNVSDLIQEIRWNWGVWWYEQINARTKALKDEAWWIFSKGLI